MLVTCPDCDRRVSDTAASCPGCGRQLRPGLGDIALERGRAAASRWRSLRIDPVFCFLMLAAGVVLIALAVHFAPDPSQEFREPGSTPSETPSIVMGIGGVVALLLSIRGYALRPGSLLNGWLSRIKG